MERLRAVATTRSRFPGHFLCKGSNGICRYVSLLNECYEVYASVRQKLVIPIVSKHLMDLSNATNASSKDLVNFASSAIISTRSICFDEFDLFFAYFSSERGEGEI